MEKLRPSQAKKMQHLKVRSIPHFLVSFSYYTSIQALCFVRPTEENVTLVVEYMKRQTFGGYYICKSRKWRICNISSTLGFYFLSAPCEVFSHIVKEPLLQRLAEGDQNEAVLLVQERRAYLKHIFPCILLLSRFRKCLRALLPLIHSFSHLIFRIKAAD